MADPDKPQSPWSPPPPPKPAKPVVRPPLDRRQWSWLLLLLLGVGVGVWAMAQFAPSQGGGEGDWPQMAQWAMLLLLMGSGVVRLRLRPHEAIRNILLWVVIAAVLGLGYTVWMQATASKHGPPPAQGVPHAAGAPTQQARLDVSREA